MKVLEKILFAGFGGQGILSIGKIFADACIENDMQASWLPSYGPEMRGGTANCSVVIGDEPVSSPIVDRPDILAAMNLPSLDKYEGAVTPGGWIFIDSSLADRRAAREDVHAVYVPATRLAAENGMSGLANMILLGSLLEKRNAFDEGLIRDALKSAVSAKRPELYEMNLKALRLGRGTV